jgi:purine-binding chemotaxis protein CheW
MTEDFQEIKLVCFRLGRDMYAADIMRVKEIIKPLPMAGLPDAPDFIEGVINLRGSVIPVLSLRKRFRLEEPVTDNDVRLLIVSLAGQAFALVVDDVTEVISIPVKDLRPSPHFEDKVGSEHLVAVCLVSGSLVMLLNIDSILRPNEVEEVRDLEI